MTEFEQTLLFAVTGVVLVGTLIVFVWQYIRMNRRDKDDDTQSRRSFERPSTRRLGPSDASAVRTASVGRSSQPATDRAQTRRSVAARTLALPAFGDSRAQRADKLGPAATAAASPRSSRSIAASHCRPSASTAAWAPVLRSTITATAIGSAPSRRSASTAFSAD